MLVAMPPNKKPAPKGSKKEPNPNAVFVRLDDDTAEALKKYVSSLEAPPERTTVITVALRQFLERKGFLKPPPKPAG